MLSVSNKTKELFKADSTYKEMEVKIYDGLHPTVFDNENIYYESFELSESILDGNSMTFMGCISSEMRVTIRNVNDYRETAFNDCKVEVKVTPYEEVPTKNKMPVKYLAGNIDTVNGITYTVNDDLSVDVVGTAQIEVSEGVYEGTDSEFEIAHFVVLEAQTLILSACLGGYGISGVREGIFTVTSTDSTIRTFEDIGNDTQITFAEGDECSYKIFIKTNETVDTTFYPMLRATNQDRTYVHYGYDLVAADTVKLFTGYIDSGEYDNDRSYIKLTAYDVLYKLNSFNVWNWYRLVAFGGKNHNDNTSLETLLIGSGVGLVDYIDTNSGYDLGFDINNFNVILSNVKIKRRLKSKEMTATNFLKSFCQLSCAMAIINRDGDLKLVYLTDDMENETIDYYRGMSSKDYVIRPFSKGITIRTNSDDTGVTLVSAVIEVDTMPTASEANYGKVYHYLGSTTQDFDHDAYYQCKVEEVGGVDTYYWDEVNWDVNWDSDTGDNYVVDDDDSELETGLYFIENNGLVKNLNSKKRLNILNEVLSVVQNGHYVFKPHELVCNGLPYVECGDSVTYIVPDSGEIIEGEIDGHWDDDPDSSTGADTVATQMENTTNVNVPVTVELTFKGTVTNSYQRGRFGIFNTTTGGDPTNENCFCLDGAAIGTWMSTNRPGSTTSLKANDKITFSNYGGTCKIQFIQYNNGSPVAYDWNPDTFVYTTMGGDLEDAPIYALNNSMNEFYSISYGGRFGHSYVSMKLKYEVDTRTKIKLPILNRKLKGIQAMVDTFSFELPNTSQTYGGTTSGVSDENIAAESSTASEKLTGETVITLVSFENGVLTTSSKQI